MRSLLLIGVEGHETRLNDALFRPALWQPEPDEYIDENDGPKTLVYFGGDIQDFFHLMDQSDPSVPYKDWCLDNTAKRLGEDFPQHHIVVIRSSRIAKGGICCYDNFVEGNRFGAPKHVYHYDALIHLERLLMTISMKIRSMAPEALYKYLLMPRVEIEDELMSPKERERYRRMQPLTVEERDSLCWFQENMNLHKYPLTLVGFSKGCVVLNQFLFEFHYARHLEPRKQDSRFISRIEDMFWLDGAHPLNINTWISTRAPLLTFAKLGIKVHVHVSAYQVEDEKRPWIGRDEEEFTKTLKSLNVNVFRHFHASPRPDLFAHFAVLERFMVVERRLNRAPPLDAATCFMVTCKWPPEPDMFSYYIVAVPNASSVTKVPADTQTPTPIYRKTYDLDAVELVPGLFLMCNVNLFKTDDGGHDVVLSVFQVLGPDSDEEDAPWRAMLPRDHPALSAPQPARRPTPRPGPRPTPRPTPRPARRIARPPKSVLETPVDLRTTLNTEHSFVTELGSLLPAINQKVILALILRESFELPPLAPSRFPRIRYRFDIWEDHTSTKIEYSVTLSVLQVASTELPDRSYTKIKANYACGPPADIPAAAGEGAPPRPDAGLCFSVLTQVPTTDPELNNRDANVNGFVYEHNHIAAIPKLISVPQTDTDDRPAPRPSGPAIVSVGSRSNATASTITNVGPDGTTTADTTTAGQATATSQPASTAQPTAISQPASTAQPTATSQPATTAQPTATSQPATTAQPTATSQPASTAQPTATSQPVTTAQPTATSQPASTAQPTATSQPASTAQPTATSQPASTAQPTATSQPASTAQPTATSQPASTAQPTATYQPASTAQPTAISQPASTAQPSTSSQHLSSCRCPTSCRRSAPAEPYDMTLRPTTFTAQSNASVQSNATVRRSASAQPYDMTLRSTSVTAQSNASVQSNATVRPIATAQPYDMTLRPTSVTAQSNASVQSNATVRPNATAQPYDMTLRSTTVTALSNASVQSNATVRPIATAQPYDMTLRPTSVTAQSNASVQSNATVRPNATAEPYDMTLRPTVTAQSNATVRPYATAQPYDMTLRPTTFTAQSNASVQSNATVRPNARAQPYDMTLRPTTFTAQSNATVRPNARAQPYDMTLRPTAFTAQSNTSVQSNATVRPNATAQHYATDQENVVFQRNATAQHYATAQENVVFQRNAMAQHYATAQENVVFQRNAPPQHYATAREYVVFQRNATAQQYATAQEYVVFQRDATAQYYATAQEDFVFQRNATAQHYATAQENVVVQRNATAQLSAAAQSFSIAQLLATPYHDTMY